MRSIKLAGRGRRGGTKTPAGTRVIGEVISNERLPQDQGVGDDPGFTGKKGAPNLPMEAPEVQAL